MKKIVALFLLCLLLCGCNSLPEVSFPEEVSSELTPLEELRDKLNAENKHFAVLFAGGFPTEGEAKAFISDKNNFADYPFVSEIPEERFVSVSEGWEVFCIIPASDSTGVAVNAWCFEETDSDYKEVKGELIYQNGVGEPFFVKCNISDIMPDSLVTLYLSDGTEVTWHPTISLKDGTVARDKSIALDITEYDFPTEE